jgi:alkyl sulfatase BDS1-like metallo-beta-lactamase superfamily hydrolase
MQHMNIVWRAMAAATALALGATAVMAAQPAKSEARRLLEARNTDLRQDIVRVAEGVYTAVGYSPANISMIVGSTGLVIVDTGMAPPHAAGALAEFRKISTLPVAAIILTHGHGDHTGGAAVFTRDASPQVWARDNFGSEDKAFTAAGLKVQDQRGSRQGGFRLPPEQRINNGIAGVFYPPQGGAVFAGNQPVKPTHTFAGARQTLEVAGLTLELVAAPGETDDQLYVWLPARKVLFSGDNFYGSWPNLYAIRGTPYRDVRAWADANDMMLKEGAEALVPGHTRPLLGKEAVATALTDYRDAIRHVFDKTIEGMNQGLSPDELVHTVQLPAALAGKDYLQGFYGNREWAVRAIFDGYLGWFDGNPTHLFSLAPREEAQRMAELAGGPQALLAKAQAALAGGDAQWAAQLADHLIALDPRAPAPLLLKADALSVLAEALLTATGRNYYLTVAQELRARAQPAAGR